jgi:hypothetical protein
MQPWVSSLLQFFFLVRLQVHPDDWWLPSQRKARWIILLIINNVKFN